MNPTDLNSPLLLDEGTIAELRDVMEDEFVDLIDSFLSDLPVQLDTLQTAIIQQSADAVYRVAHRLKSSCGTIGALRLTDEVRQLELAGRQNSLGQAPALLDRVRAVAEETVVRLQALQE
ncbi:MAG: histidine phosphotransfer protein HptB [Pseudomonadota bacterium]|nr:histidine phosphotransfer protein HptB [Pseudomonadota bacterium]